MGNMAAEQGPLTSRVVPSQPVVSGAQPVSSQLVELSPCLVSQWSSARVQTASGAQPVPREPVELRPCPASQWSSVHAQIASGAQPLYLAHSHYLH